MSHEKFKKEHTLFKECYFNPAVVQALCALHIKRTMSALATMPDIKIPDKEKPKYLDFIKANKDLKDIIEEANHNIYAKH